MSDSSLKLRNLILNTSKHSNSTNRFRSSGEKQTQTLVAKLPKKNENEKAYEESIKNLKLEAKILAAMNHDNVVGKHAMSDDTEKNMMNNHGCLDYNGGINNNIEECPRFFIVLDCLSSTLDQKINSLNEIKSMKRSDSVCSTASTTMAESIDDDSITDRLDILHGISSAMRYIHKQNIMHRDIKPDNVGFDGKIIVLFNMIITYPCSLISGEANY